MRFIVREQDSERLLAAGLYRYETGAGPTGVTESWRLTDVIDRYRVLRIDYDSRESASGNSLLYHLIINRKNRPERLKIRFFGPDLDGWVNANFAPDRVTMTQLYNERRFENELSISEHSNLFFGSAAWSGFIIQDLLAGDETHGISLTREDRFLLRTGPVKIVCNDEIELVVGSKRVNTKRCQLKILDQIHQYWLDDYNFTVQADLGLGERVVETRYIRPLEYFHGTG